MLGKGGLGYINVFFYFSDRLLSLSQRAENQEAPRIGDLFQQSRRQSRMLPHRILRGWCFIFHVDIVLEISNIVKIIFIQMEGVMTKNYPEITKGISANLKVLRKDIADTMQGFSSLAQAATRDGALDKKTKELIALALGVAARCDGCIGFHTEALVKLGTTREEMEEVLGMSIYMGGGPSLMYAADALAAYEQFKALAG